MTENSEVQVSKADDLGISSFEDSEDEIKGFPDTEGESQLSDSSDVHALEISDSSNSHKIRKLDIRKRAKKLDKKAENAEKNNLSPIIFISRLPRGFHERELSKYFSQFGDLRQLRLARNKKTGNSRHYGFIEFVNKDDALVAQETMNNYLLMGHLIKVVVLPKGSTIQKLFKYKRRVHRELGIKDSEKVKKRAEAKHLARIKKLREAGIDFAW